MEKEPSPVQILEQLENIVSSADFVASPRKRKFLRYIVEKTLAGEAASLKGYAIGVDVFDRGDDFDPQLDTIVRVQARNLRRAVKLYNLSQGQNDLVKIKLRKGSYVPMFGFVEPKVLEADALIDDQADHLPDQTNKPVTSPKRHSRILGVALLAAVFAGLVWMFIWVSNGNTRNGFDQAALVPTGPSVSIAPFEIIDDETGTNSQINIENLRSGLHVELVDKISRFKDLFVLEAGSSTQSRRTIQPIRETQFGLTGTIQRSGDAIRVTTILKRLANGEILWSRSHSEVLDSPSALLKIQSDIAIDVAASLGQPYSRINSRFMTEQSDLADLDIDDYLCLMRFYNYLKAKSGPEHSLVRNCLEKATIETPGFSSGWAALSWMYADEAFNNFNVRSNQAPPMERALRAAQEAVRADPDNAMAYQYLAIAKFQLGDDRGFREAGENALRLNPNDAEVLADIGSHLIQMENSDQGWQMVEKAISMNSAHPSWYHGSIFMYHYTRGDSETALHHAREYLSDGSLAAHIFHAAALVQGGQLEEGRKAYMAMVETYPHFPNEYQTILDEMRMPEGMPAQLIEDLTLAGLTPVL